MPAQHNYDRRQHGTIRIGICLIAIAVLGVFASAQTPTGTIQGVVTDKTGAAVQGASVTVIRTTTNETKMSTTDSAGRYSFVFVEPGVYNVSAEAKGFRAARQDNVLVQVTETRPVNFTLEVGAVAQTVEVNAQDVQALDTETSSLGETIQTETILQLPDQGRNPFDFAFLVAGVNNVGSASTPHIGGSRNGNNEQLIDGMTNVTPENNIGNNISTYTPVEDSVQEMNVQTNVLPAEYGRFSGGTESLVTKAGGNQWHGTYSNSSRGRTNGSRLRHWPKKKPNSASQQYQWAALSAVRSSKIGRSSSLTTSTRPRRRVLPQPTWFQQPDFTNGDFTSLFGSTTRCSSIRIRWPRTPRVSMSGSRSYLAANTTSSLQVASRRWRSLR